MMKRLGLVLMGAAALAVFACGSESRSIGRSDEGGAPASGGAPSGDAPGGMTMSGEDGTQGGRDGEGGSSATAGGGERPWGATGYAGFPASGSAGDDGSGAQQSGGAGGNAHAADDAAPTLTLTGGSIVLDCGASFSEPGVSAFDVEDGVLTVVTQGLDMIDTSLPGTSTITYEAQDSAGHVVKAERSVFVCGPACGELGKLPVNVSDWEVVQYEQNSQANANWVIAADGLSARQTVNADASILLSSFDTADLSIEGTWTMQSASDDDLVGFVYGYQDRGHFYLFDWKGATQVYMGSQALVGMTLKLVAATAGPPEPLQLTVADLWASAGTENVTVLADTQGQPFHNSIAWAVNKPYRFQLESHAGSFRIRVLDGDTLLTDWSVRDDRYGSGRFGFYNFSQAPILYQSFTQRSTPPACSTVE